MPQKVIFVTCSNQPQPGKNYGVTEIPELTTYLIDGYKVVDFKQMIMPDSIKLSSTWFDVVFVLEK
jgi:hypothetical protein